MALGLLLLLLLGAPAIAQPVTGGTLFTDRDPILLVFDLQDDDHPVGALIVNAVQNAGPQIHIALPFAIDAPSSNERAMFRTGSYDRWSLISLSSAGKSWPQQISFKPRITRGADQLAYKIDTRQSVFLEAQGQFRYFTYRYPAGVAMAAYAGRLGEPVRYPDAIGIEIPAGAHEIAVASGTLSIPQALRRGERVFSGAPAPSGEGLIQIAYEVPPTDAQKLIVSWGLKFIVVILPLIGLFFLPADKIRRPKWRNALVIGGAVIAVAILGLIIWAAIRTGNLLDAGFDIALVAAGCVVAGLLLFVKAKDPSATAPGPSQPPPGTP